MKRIAVLALSLLLGSCGVKETRKDMTKENLMGVWDNMGNNKCYERYVFYRNDTFSFFDSKGQSQGSFNLREQKLGLYNQGVAADYLPFQLTGDGRMSVFKNGNYKNYVKVPDTYAAKVECPGEIPDPDDGGGDPYPEPTKTPDPCPPTPNPVPTPAPRPVPTITPTPVPPSPCPPPKCTCSCTCDPNPTMIYGYGFDNLECGRRFPPPPPPSIPVPPRVEPCPPCQPCPPPTNGGSGNCKCTCKCV